MCGPVEFVIIEEIIIGTDIFEEFDEIEGGELPLFLTNNYTDIAELCPFSIPQTDHFIGTGSDIFANYFLVLNLILDQVILIANRIQ